jgi:hypothetical protein
MLMFYCKACAAYYDGFAQCCFDMDHIIYEVDDETNNLKNNMYISTSNGLRAKETRQ